MDVILVTTSFNAEVHGTFNGKKTGCGINLLKPENATRFRRGSTMTDLGELTCEKCKTKIAKEMIKSDSKEMKVLLKEERMRAKKGIEDSGIVPLGNTTAKITSAPRPAAPPVSQRPQAELEPAPAQPTNIPAPAPGAPALDAELAKFAINAPHTPENSFPQSEPEPAPAPAPAPADDFMSQFAIQKPEEPAPDPEPAVEEDFLAQFAVDVPDAQPSAPAEPAPAPVIDDVSAALAAMQQNPAIQPAPAQPASQPELANGNEWDLIANQLFGDVPAQPEIAPAPQPISEPVQPDMNEFIQTGPAEMAELPTDEPVMDIPFTSAPIQNAPVIDDISSALNALNTPIQPAAPVQTAPVAEPVMPAPAPAVPVQEAPVIDDISSALNALNAPVQPAAPAPKPVQAAPVLDDISAVINAAQPVAPAEPAPVAEIAPAKPASAQPAPVDALFDALDSFVQPVQPTAPAKPAPAKPAAPAPSAGVPSVGQVISVPQITGYNDKNEPVFTYIKMRIQSFDAKGQPVLVPLPGQNIPLPTAPDTTPRSALDKNTRLKDAMAAAMETPTDSRDMTPGQRIAAANAAKGAPVSANVSKIATNEHTKATSQVFVKAISVSKEYANESLTETQGLKQRTAVLDSIEDVLSQFGDNSLKEKKLAEQQAAANAPVVDEYKGPVRTYSSRPAPRPSAPKQPAMPDRPLTKSELKAMKKQEKIDAKFQKEMAKRGR